MNKHQSNKFTEAILQKQFTTAERPTNYDDGKSVRLFPFKGARV